MSLSYVTFPQIYVLRCIHKWKWYCDDVARTRAEEEQEDNGAIARACAKASEYSCITCGLTVFF
jgi:hypothetical protein